MKRKALKLLWPVVVLSLLLTVGIVWAEGVPGVTDTEIRIGQWGPQTGPAAPWGAVSRGTAVYFDMINEEGGINGRKIKYFMFDDQYNPAKTKAGVKELVEGEGIFGFVGGVGTAPGLAVMDYLTEKGLVWVGPSTGSSHWIEPLKRNVFAVYPQYADEAAALVKYAVETMGKKKIAFFYQNDDFGKGGLEGAHRQLKKYNLELAIELPAEPADRDLKSHTMKLKQADPEVVIMWVMPTHGVILRKTAAAMNFQPTWMTTSALSDAPMMEQITGGLWQGTIFANFAETPDSELPLMKKYYQAYEKYAAKGERWGVFFYAGFGFAEPMVEGLRRCGNDLSQENFIKQMETLKDFKGIFGRITYTPERRQGQKEIFLSEALAGGKVKRLSDWIEADL